MTHESKVQIFVPEKFKHLCSKRFIDLLVQHLDDPSWSRHWTRGSPEMSSHFSYSGYLSPSRGLNLPSFPTVYDVRLFSCSLPEHRILSEYALYRSKGKLTVTTTRHKNNTSSENISLLLVASEEPRTSYSQLDT